MKFDKKVIIVGGRKVFYRQAQDKQKDVLVFLHGFPGNHAGLIDLARGFGTNYRIVIPDMPACGQSEALSKKHILKHYAEWLNNFLNIISVDTAIIIGHSFGSRVALSFAIYYPEKVSKLVLVTPVLKIDNLLARLAALKGKIAKILPKKLQKLWLSNKLYQNAVRIIIFKSASEKRRKEISAMDVQELKHLDVAATMEIFDEFHKSDLIPLADAITAKTFIVAGEKDEIVTLRSIKMFASQLPEATYVVMENAGHLLPLEKPLATAQVIRSWLNHKS